MGRPKTQTVTTTQKQELDPIAQGYLWSGQLPMEKMASLRRINERVYGYAPGTLTPVPTETAASTDLGNDPYKDSPMQERRQEERIQAHIDDVNSRNGRDSSGGLGGFGSGLESIGVGIGDYVSGVTSAARDLGRAALGMEPKDEEKNMARGGIVALANGGMVPPMMGGRMPDLSNRDMAYLMAMRAQGYAMGGYIEGPGTGTSDSIPAKIYQDGKPVQEAALSDGEFVMTKKAVDGAGGPARMYEMMRRFERGGRVG